MPHISLNLATISLSKLLKKITPLNILSIIQQVPDYVQKSLNVHFFFIFCGSLGDITLQWDIAHLCDYFSNEIIPE